MLFRAIIAVVISLPICAACGDDPGAHVAVDPYAHVRGMTVSCQTWGWEWGSDDMITAMQELKAMGVNWIAIHPYAGIRQDGTVSSGRMGREQDGDHPQWLRRPIEEAHRLGLKIMIKPHIAYWGSGFKWRGEIAFGNDDAAWQNFFETYRAWILDVATICHDADAFVVGTELDQTVRFESEWRAIISDVRNVMPAVPLTYAANWDQYQQIRFWNDLDVIGIQAYFPLVGHRNTPETDELTTAWQRVLQAIEHYACEHDRRVVFTELGYNTSSLAAHSPWESQSGGPHAEMIQERCLSAALQSLREPDVVAGAFLWKWFPGSPHGENFLMSTPAMRRVIHRCWGGTDAPH
ncbi:MAG: glycoside hydrolase family 113 [Phycisphaerales bacterium]